MSERARLDRRLRRVEVLAREGATEGERRAAREAARRLRARLRVDTPTPADDPILFSQPGLRLPTREVLRDVLLAWSLDELDDQEVGDWARRYVDGLLLPDLPADHPDSIDVEVVLQLSTLPGGPVDLRHLQGLRDFLDTHPTSTRDGWRRWFRYLEGVPPMRLGGQSAQTTRGREGSTSARATRRPRSVK